MKWGVILFSTMAAMGVVAALCGNAGHLLFSTLPCTAVALAEFIEYRKEKRRKSTLKNIQQ